MCVCVCVIPGSLIGRALSRKDRDAVFESHSRILLLQHLLSTDGSSPYTSSPTGALSIAWRMSSVGSVTVSDLRSTRRADIGDDVMLDIARRRGY